MAEMEEAVDMTGGEGMTGGAMTTGIKEWRRASLPGGKVEQFYL
jgi:hypothetical protein